jgi:mono/diheme cytochrome c family protein
MRSAFLASLFTAFLAVGTVCLLPSTRVQAAPAASLSPAAKLSPEAKLSLAATTAPAATPPPSVHAGKEIFTKNCMQCHSVVEGVVTFGPSLYGEMKPPHPHKTAAEVRVIIKNGKNGANGRVMPPFGERLSAEDVDNLLAYIRTL